MKFIESNFLLFILCISSLSLLFPEVFVVLLPYLSYLLALVMLFMGITLKKEELVQAIKNWRFAVLGTALQFLLMPSIAYFVSWLFDFPLEYRLGMVLVGSCPGGTSSNVITYLFRGNVSLSVLMTFMSTVLSVVFTPFLMELYLGKQMDLPVAKMIQDIFVLVLLPLVLGFLIQKFNSPKGNELVEKSSSIVAFVVIALIIGAVLAANKTSLGSVSYLLIVAVALHNGLGLLLGYLGARLFTKDKTIARTIAIEVGMQNSGLGVVLANLHFTKLVALPSAIFSFWHNVSGVLLAGYWKRRGS